MNHDAVNNHEELHNYNYIPILSWTLYLALTQDSDDYI